MNSAVSVLPLRLQSQLQRVGIELEHPTDLYVFKEEEGGGYCRVIFHAVGKILSGPVAWLDDPNLGQVLNYKELRPAPSLLALAVLPSREVANAGPNHTDHAAGDLLQIDLRLFLPQEKGTALKKAPPHRRSIPNTSINGTPGGPR